MIVPKNEHSFLFPRSEGIYEAVSKARDYQQKSLLLQS